MIVKEHFLKILLQLPELKKEQSDSYGTCGYGRHHANWVIQQQQGGINGYSHHNSHSRH